MTGPLPRRLLAALLAAALAAGGLAACELPQNKGGGGSSDDAGGDAGGEGTRTWRMLRLTDRSGADPSALPGSDIDAVVVFRDGQFLFAGCEEASLFEQDTAAFPDNPHDDPGRATLGVREDDPGAGFVSLAGGTLLCELPIPAMTGDRLAVWELDADGAEPWEAAFAESAGGTFVSAGGETRGSGELDVP